jgi:hypothetical protein
MECNPGRDDSSSSRLRRELGILAKKYAQRLGPHASYESAGGTLMFLPTPDGLSHGNFHPDSYSAIRSRSEWAVRLEKKHPQRRHLPEKHREAAKELDSSTSSDALLMNIACFPGFVHLEPVKALLALEAVLPMCFGWKAKVPLTGRDVDATEVDLRIGDLLIESKLTEADFTTKQREIVKGYGDFSTLFDSSRLTVSDDDERFDHYQLIRNILAAWHHRLRFCLVCDARRLDLAEAFQQTLSAVREPALRNRCFLVTWQQLAEVAPASLRTFLLQKYGLSASTRNVAAPACD